jgi:hypothetical protein
LWLIELGAGYNMDLTAAGKDDDCGRPQGKKAAKQYETDAKIRIAMTTAHKRMAEQAEKRNELLEEQNDIAVCMANPESDDSVAFFRTRQSIARLKAEARLAALREAAANRAAASPSSGDRSPAHGSVSARAGARGAGAGSGSGVHARALTAARIGAAAVSGNAAFGGFDGGFGGGAAAD